MADVNISIYRASVVREGSTPASPGFVVSDGQNPVDPSGSGQNHLPVTIGSPANGLAVTDAQILTIDKAQIFAGTSSQFVKGDGTLDSTAYGTGSVTSVGLTMPTAFSVANSPVTTAGTLAVTATGTTSQYIRGDGSLETFPALTGFVPYTGATADVNLGNFDLLAQRGTFENNGSSDALTVNQTSGSGYGIIVTKGGANEALYVSKTSGSGNAMTVVGGRTSLVDLALSSVTNTAGDFLTLSGGVVHKRTAAQTLADIGGQAALTNPVTGTGTTNYLPKFTGASTIGNSIVQEGTNTIGINTTGYTISAGFTGLGINNATNGGALDLLLNDVKKGEFYITSSSFNMYGFAGVGINLTVNNDVSKNLSIATTGNVLINTTTDAGFKLDVNGTGRFSGALRSNDHEIKNSANSETLDLFLSPSTLNGFIDYPSGRSLTIRNKGSLGSLTIASTGAATFSSSVTSSFFGFNALASYGFTSYDGATPSGKSINFSTGYYGGYDAIYQSSGNTNDFGIWTNGGSVTQAKLYIKNNGNVLIGTTTDDSKKLRVNGTISSLAQDAYFLSNLGNGTDTKNWSIQNLDTSGQFRIRAGNDAQTDGINAIVISRTGISSVSISISGAATFTSLGTGSVTATSGLLSTVSDLNYKVENGFIDSAIEKVLKLKPRYFYWNEKSGLPTNVKQLGFYAQEVNEALGEEAANTPQDKNTPWGISDRSIIAMLTKAIQELKQEIDTLKTN
jgi:hypothetical protein